MTSDIVLITGDIPARQLHEGLVSGVEKGKKGARRIYISTSDRKEITLTGDVAIYVLMDDNEPAGHVHTEQWTRR